VERESDSICAFERPVAEALEVAEAGDVITNFEGGGEACVTLFDGDSTIWAVELKYRARLGSRNAGGNVDDRDRKSENDHLMLLRIMLAQ
jgi:hypothetical protein